MAGATTAATTIMIEGNRIKGHSGMVISGESAARLDSILEHGGTVWLLPSGTLSPDSEAIDTASGAIATTETTGGPPTSWWEQVREQVWPPPFMAIPILLAVIVAVMFLRWKGLGGVETIDGPEVGHWGDRPELPPNETFR